MKEDNSRHYLKRTEMNGFLLLQLFLTLFLYPTHVLASGDLPRFQANGELTGIENGTTLIIDDRRYDVDKSVLVVDTADRPIELNKLSMPIQVIFEFSYQERSQNTMAPVIVFVKEAIEKSHNGRSLQ